MKKALAILLTLSTAVAVWAIGHYDAVDRNTAPSGVATNVWAWVGEAMCFSYTGLPAGFMCNAVIAVGPRAFATASHIGYTPNFISYQGSSYAVTGEILLSGPEGDCKIITIGTDVASYAPSYTNTSLPSHSSATFPDTDGRYILVGNGAEGSLNPPSPSQTGINSTGLNTKRWASGTGLRVTNAIICSGAIDSTNFVKFQTFFENSTGEGAAAMAGDSGSAVFIFNTAHNRYEFLGSYSCADAIPQYNTWASTGFVFTQHLSTFGAYVNVAGSGTAPPAVVPSTKDKRSLAGGRRKR